MRNQASVSSFPAPIRRNPFPAPPRRAFNVLRTAITIRNSCKIRRDRCLRKTQRAALQFFTFEQTGFPRKLLGRSCVGPVLQKASAIPTANTDERPRRDNTGWDETFVEAKVTYHIEIEGTSILVRNVPARLNVETGERLFSPEIVERLQEIVRSECHPARLIETPVYEYA